MVISSGTALMASWSEGVNGESIENGRGGMCHEAGARHREGSSFNDSIVKLNARRETVIYAHDLYM